MRHALTEWDRGLARTEWDGGLALTEWDKGLSVVGRRISNLRLNADDTSLATNAADLFPK